MKALKLLSVLMFMMLGASQVIKADTCSFWQDAHSCREYDKNCQWVKTGKKKLGRKCETRPKNPPAQAKKRNSEQN